MYTAIQSAAKNPGTKRAFSPPSGILRFEDSLKMTAAGIGEAKLIGGRGERNPFAPSDSAPMRHWTSESRHWLRNPRRLAVQDEQLLTQRAIGSSAPAFSPIRHSGRTSPRI